MKALILCIFLSLLWIVGRAQRPDRQADYWFFGGEVSMYFQDGGDPSLASGLNQMTTETSSMVYTSKEGKLELYSNSSRVWNKAGGVVEGAEALVPSADPRYPGLIVPIPDRKEVFYIFSIDNTVSDNPIYYHKINMRFNGGNGKKEGDFETLATSSSNGITTVKHCNNKDYWLITHTKTGNGFEVYLIDKSGIKLSKITSNKGTPFSASSNGKQQEIIASEDGTLLAITKPDAPDGGFLEIFDFDNSTGEVTKRRTKKDDLGGITGAAFSPDGNHIFVSRLSKSVVIDDSNMELEFEVVQYKTKDDPNFEEVVITKKIDSKRINGSGPFIIDPEAFGNLKLGPNGKIYLSHIDASFLSVIHKPNSVASASNFIYGDFYLGSKKARGQLPATIAPDYPILEIDLVFQNNSPCNPTLLINVTGLEGNDTEYQWYLDGEPISGATSKTQKATASGNYSVLAQKSCQEFESNLKAVIVAGVVEAPLVDTTFQYCQGDEITILQALGTDIKWYSDAALSNVISTSQDFEPPINSNDVGKTAYFVTQTKANCESPAGKISFEISKNQPISLSDNLLEKCLYETGGVELKITQDTDEELEWYLNGEFLSNETAIQATEYGTYLVKTQNDFCPNSDTLVIINACFGIYIPTAFSPNGDGLNELFLLKGSGTYEFDFEIINLHGRVVSHFKNATFNDQPFELWDGIYAGKPAPMGSYYYIFEARIEKNGVIRTERQTGALLLLR